jgi:hypothetical protein
MSERSVAISRAGLLVALTVVLFFLLRMPVLGLVAAVILPVPMTMLGVRHGPRYLIMGLSGILFLAMLIFGPGGFFLYLPFASCSLALGWGFHLKAPIGRVLLAGAILMLVTGLADFYIGSHIAGFDPGSEFTKFKKTASVYLENNLLNPAKEGRARVASEYSQLLEQQTVSIEEADRKKTELSELIQVEEKSRQLILHLKILMENPYPILLFWLFMFLVVEILVSRFFVHRFQFGEVPPIRFTRWKCPGVVTWVFLVGILSYLGVRQSDLTSRMDWLIGIGYAMQLVYFVFGLSFISFFMLRWKLSVPIRVALVFAGFMFMQILVFLGFFDSLFNVRKSHGDEAKKIFR